MTNQCAKAFTRHRGPNLKQTEVHQMFTIRDHKNKVTQPYLKGVVITARHNPVARKLEASNHMVVMALQHLQHKDVKV